MFLTPLLPSQGGTMTARMKLPLKLVFSIFATVGLVGCSSSNGPTSVYTPSDDAGGSGGNNNSNDSGSTGTGTSKDAGGGGGGGDSGGSSSCVIPEDWQDNSPSGTCSTCEQTNCCAMIVACNADTGCKAIYDCQNNCYSGIGADGGQISQDGGIVDDAGDTAEDLCAQGCTAAGSTASQALFTPQDNCVNGTACGTPCD